MSLKYAIGAALATGVLATAPVSAADTLSSSERAQIDQAFTRLDTNNDGGIDKAEAQKRPRLEQNFSQYDTDHSGKLGKDEFAAAVNAERLARSDTRSAATGGTQPAGRSFESLDRNNDGNIDTTEAQGWRWLQRNFSQYDSDRNGKLGKDEFAAASNAAARR